MNGECSVWRITLTARDGRIGDGELLDAKQLEQAGLGSMLARECVFGLGQLTSVATRRESRGRNAIGNKWFRGRVWAGAA